MPNRKNPPEYPPIKKSKLGRRYETKYEERESLIHPVTKSIWLYNPTEWDLRAIPGPTPNDCYEWLGAYHRQGYGMFFVMRENDSASKTGMMNAQRFAMALELNRPLLKSERVGSSCRNLECCNPAHLYVTDYAHQHQVLPKRPFNERKRKYTEEFFLKHFDALSSLGPLAVSKITGLTYAQAHAAKQMFKKWLERV